MLRFCQIGKLALLVGTALISNAFAADNESGKLKVNGFVDGYFTFNTSNSATVVLAAPNYTFKVENALHNFTFRRNRPRLQLAEIVLERPMTEKRFGFRLDLDAGTTTQWVHQAEPAGRSWAYVQQVFVSVPLGKGYLDFGKFVTHHGAEVIESKDNWNYSRSLLFAWAIPYYHAGIRYWLPMGKSDKLCLHLYQGWNVVEDNNGSKSIGLMWQRSTDKYALTVNYTGGAELPNSSRLRHLMDVVFVKPLNAKDTLMLNADWARDNAASATWYGLAVYWRRQLNARHALTVRAEIFRDANGFATGTVQTAKEITLTYEMPFFWQRSALLRLEVRHDFSNAAVFDAGTKKRQTVFIVGIVQPF
jgi:hypothetical protein